MIVSCPSCGNKIDVMPGAVEVVCPYCNTIILIQREQIVSLGKQAPIVPFPTTFSVGKNFYAVEDEGSNDILANKKVSWYSEEDFYKNKFDNYLVKVYISGHIRCMNDSGFWDKWTGYVVDDKIKIFKNKEVLIDEDEGLIQVFEKIDSSKFKSDFENWFQNVGQVVDGYFVNEAGVYKVEGIEGQFYYPVAKQVKYIKLFNQGQTYLVEDHGNNNILSFKQI